MDHYKKNEERSHFITACIKITITPILRVTLLKLKPSGMESSPIATIYVKKVKQNPGYEVGDY